MSDGVSGIGEISGQQTSKNAEIQKKRKQLLEGGLAKAGNWVNGYNINQLGNMLNGQIKDTATTASQG